MARRKQSTKQRRRPKSIELAEPKKEVPRCKARLKTCRKCGYRYESGDKSWECPKCKEPRRCIRKAKTPYAVCRVHGAGGGRPPIHGKYTIPSKYIDRFNSIRQDPELMSLAYNIALSETRTDELLLMIHDNDAKAAYVDILSAIRRMDYDVARLSIFIDELQKFGVAEEKEYDEKYRIYKEAKKKDKKLKPPPRPKGLTTKEIRRLISKNDFDGIFIGLDEMKQAVEPANIESHLWREVSFHLELTRRLNDTERKWATAHDQMVPITLALEAIRTVMRDALEFITDPKDRHRFSMRIKGYLGE